jgi:hypothetical protein
MATGRGGKRPNTENASWQAFALSDQGVLENAEREVERTADVVVPPEIVRQARAGRSIHSCRHHGLDRLRP